jgi:hypothetical protein
LAPASLPVFAGTLQAPGLILANASFSRQQLTVGSTYLITVQGTYQLQGLTYAFQVNRFIVIPAPTAPLTTLLQARVDVSTATGVWSYTVTNDEASGSPNFINAFSLDIAAPVSVNGTPPGWQVSTDNLSYVLWYAPDQFPFPNHIAPGANLSGFAIQGASMASESTGFAVTAWNHQTDRAGLVVFGSALSPLRST